jgi:hypothetical protein
MGSKTAKVKDKKSADKPKAALLPSVSKGINGIMQRRGSIARQNRAEAMRLAEEQLAKEVAEGSV